MNYTILNPFGQEWHPEERESPHKFDYKFNIVDATKQQEVENAIAKEVSEPGSIAFTLDWFRNKGKFKKFTDGQSKQGMFIQAGAIITDGFETGNIQNVLCTKRVEEQFSNRESKRYKRGDSTVFGTCLASFKYQDHFGHIPTALLNDINENCPWALFSRKLLVPDLHVDSKFLGISYNFEKSDRKYVFLIWHVRTKKTPEVIQVYAREKKEHDVPYWCNLANLENLDLSEKPIDRLSLTQLVNGISSELPNEKCGFIVPDKYEKVRASEWTPQVVKRDEIILDVLRMYQQEFHRAGRNISAIEEAISGHKKGRRNLEVSLQKDLDSYLTSCLRGLGINHDVKFESITGMESGAGRIDMSLEINDTDGNRLFRYLLELKCTEGSSKGEEYIKQCQAYAALYSTPSKTKKKIAGFDAIILVHGIIGTKNPYGEYKRVNPYPIQGSITHPSNDMPIHVIRIALRPMSPSVKTKRSDVAHAIIVFKNKKGVVENLLFTKKENDECPRLPGGKVEGDQTPKEALLRELMEELKLSPSDIEADIRPVVPEKAGQLPGVIVDEMSVKHGYIKPFRFHPFWIKLTEEGRKKVCNNIGKTDHFPFFGNIEEWKNHGNGAGMAYPDQIVPFLTPELMQRFAHECCDDS